MESSTRASIGEWKQLHAAAKSGSKNRLLMMLRRSAIDIDEGDDTGTPPLHIAANEGNVTNVSTLLQHEASVLAANRDDGTAHHISAWNGDHAVSHVLLRAGALVDVVNNFGCMSRTLSARFEHAMATVVLRTAGANANHRLPSGEAPLFKAAEVESPGTVNVLLRARRTRR